MQRILAIDYVAFAAADLEATCAFYDMLFGARTHLDYALDGKSLVRQIALGGALQCAAGPNTHQRRGGAKTLHSSVLSIGVESGCSCRGHPTAAHGEACMKTGPAIFGRENSPIYECRTGRPPVSVGEKSRLARRS